MITSSTTRVEFRHLVRQGRLQVPQRGLSRLYSGKLSDCSSSICV